MPISSQQRGTNSARRNSVDEVPRAATQLQGTAPASVNEWAEFSATPARGEQRRFVVGQAEWDAFRAQLSRRARAVGGVCRCVSGECDQSQFDCEQGPEPLAGWHKTRTFDCGMRPLDAYIHHQALAEQHAAQSRVFVVSTGTRVKAYFSLAVGHVELAEEANESGRQRPVSVICMARLAVSVEAQGRGLGRILLADALDCTVSAAELYGARALLAFAADARAQSFYGRYGFEPSQLEPHLLMLRVKDIRKALSGS